MYDGRTIPSIESGWGPQHSFVGPQLWFTDGRLSFVQSNGWDHIEHPIGQSKLLLPISNDGGPHPVHDRTVWSHPRVWSNGWHSLWLRTKLEKDFWAPSNGPESPDDQIQWPASFSTLNKITFSLINGPNQIWQMIGWLISFLTMIRLDEEIFWWNLSGSKQIWTAKNVVRRLNTFLRDFGTPIYTRKKKSPINKEVRK